MGCLKPLFKLLCGCCVQKKRNLGGGAASYSRVPTDEFEFDEPPAGEKGPSNV
jgi:hypothetical protein